ncbi:MAG: hypothetical protein OXI73_02245 [Rhodospirillales bacterium]|nr:hypothetical protein [Rhodospirillales bacterium]
MPGRDVADIPAADYADAPRAVAIAEDEALRNLLTLNVEDHARR